MEITLYENFSKRKNSTKQPTGTGIVKEVRLKDTCSFINPSFFLADANRYVYLKAWNNYYFIDSVEYDINGASYINCSIDVLATYKNAILSTTSYVKYSTSNFNKDIIDNRITGLVTSDYNVIDYDFYGDDPPPPLFVDGGSVVLTVCNNTRGLTNYVMSFSNFEALIHDYEIYADNIVGHLIIKWGAIYNSFLTARWLPIVPEDFPKKSSEREAIRIGDHDFGQTAYVLTSNPAINKSWSIDIPWRYNDFRRYNGYTNIFITIPYVGKIEVDTMEINGFDKLRLNYCINPLTGTADVFLYASVGAFGFSSKMIGTYSASIGKTIPISATSVDSEGALAGAIGIITSTATSGMPLLESANTIKKITETGIALLNHSTTTVGGYSGSVYTVFRNNPVVEVISRDTRTDPNELTTLYGRPCNKVLQIGSLTGYVQTESFSIEISALENIKTMINEAMDNGVYLE